MSEYKTLKAEYKTLKLRLVELNTLAERARHAWYKTGTDDKKERKETDEAEKNSRDMSKRVKALAYKLTVLEHKEVGTSLNKLFREYGITTVTIKKLLKENSVAYLRPTMVQWLPIGTAPKDDTDVLLFCNGDILIGSFAAGMWWVQQTSYKKHDPTHWMPLPKPPVLEEGKNEQ